MMAHAISQPSQKRKGTPPQSGRRKKNVKQKISKEIETDLFRCSCSIVFVKKKHNPQAWGFRKKSLSAERKRDRSWDEQQQKLTSEIDE